MPTTKQVQKDAMKLAGSVVTVLNFASDAHGDPSVLRAAVKIIRGFSGDPAEQPIIDACATFWEQRANQMEAAYRRAYGPKKYQETWGKWGQ